MSNNNSSISNAFSGFLAVVGAIAGLSVGIDDPEVGGFAGFLVGGFMGAIGGFIVGGIVSIALRLVVVAIGLLLLFNRGMFVLDFISTSV